MRAFNEFYMRKVMTLLCLIVAGGIFAVIFNFENTGVFLNVNRKLPIYSVDTQDKKIALTFDASWGEDKTEEILDILDKYNVKATFFLLGGWVDRYPEKVKAMKERGHEIGNHTYNHPDMTRISKEKIIREIAAADAKIQEVTGEGTTLFRFPAGSYNNAAVEVVESTNHYIIQWDVDSIDWKAQGADIEYERVISNTKPGSILLFHNDALYTPENLPRVLESLLKKGYTFVKVSDLIYKDNYHIDVTGRQIKGAKKQ